MLVLVAHLVLQTCRPALAAATAPFLIVGSAPSVDPVVATSTKGFLSTADIALAVCALLVLLGMIIAVIGWRRYGWHGTREDDF